MKTLRKLFVVSVPTAGATLLFMEAILRLGGYRPYYLDGAAFIPSKNPEMIYEWRPGFHGLYAGIPISINSRGFRGRELSESAEHTSNFQIVVLGDSVAFGQAVPEGETLAEDLATRLKLLRGVRAESVNLGVPGYDTCQEYWMFKEKGIPLKPNVAILLYVENDTDPPVFQVSGNTVVSPDIRTGRFGSFMAWLRKHSDVYNFAWTRWQLVKQPKFTVAGYRDVLRQKFNDGNPGWRKSRGCLADMVSLAKANSIRMIVIPTPILAGIGENPYPFDDYVKSVCDAARADGAECLDVEPFLRTPGIRLRSGSVDPHPSGQVYGIIADHVAPLLGGALVN